MRRVMIASTILWVAVAGSGCERKTAVRTAEPPVREARVVGLVSSR